MSRCTALVVLHVSLASCWACGKDATTSSTSDGTTSSPTAPSTTTPTFPGVSGAVIHSYDLNQGVQEWTSGFSSYEIGHEDRKQFVSSYHPLPASLGQALSGIYLGAMGLVTVYVSRQVSGLSPGALYDAVFAVELATPYMPNCAGGGGPPGDSRVSVGATTSQPQKTVSGASVVLNVPTASASSESGGVLVIGNMYRSYMATTVDQYCSLFELKEFASNSTAVRVRADASGSVWLIVAVDAASYSWLETYVTKVAAGFTPVQ
jgi:hypothetical protein